MSNRIDILQAQIQAWEQSPLNESAKSIIIKSLKKELEMIFENMRDITNENAKATQKSLANKPVNGCGKSANRLQDS